MNVETIAPTPAALAAGRDLQMLWISLLKRPWTTLAVLPTEPSASARDLMGALAEIAHYHEAARQVEIIDVGGLPPGDGIRQAQNLGARVNAGKRVVLLVDPITTSLQGLPLVNEAQAVLLVLRYGSAIEAARSTAELVGRDRILGAVALPPRG